ncbi:MAG: hypothetical protein PHS93_10015 [Candidatus Omnitrophica bacterium]|nr:hypothetical protein [Candidatus Omnitrophota bacterium]
MKYLFVLLLPILLLCSCAPQDTNAPFPPPDGYSSWEEYNKVNITNTTKSISTFLPLPSLSEDYEYQNFKYGYKVSYLKPCRISTEKGPETIIFIIGDGEDTGLVGIIVEDLNKYVPDDIDTNSKSYDDSIYAFLLIVSDDIIQNSKNDYPDLVVNTNKMVTDYIRIVEISFSNEGYHFKCIYHLYWHDSKLYKLYGQMTDDSSYENNVRYIINGLQFVE